jgi:hypothetical protein
MPASWLAEFAVFQTLIAASISVRSAGRTISIVGADGNRERDREATRSNIWSLGDACGSA